MRLLCPDLFLKHSFLCSSIANLTENTYCVFPILYVACFSIHVPRKNGDACSYLVGVDSVMGYRVMFDRTSLREIPEGGIVSQEEVEIQLGMELERNFSA